MWVFGYGSLLWNPGFDYVEKQIACLYGYHRSFCMRSIHHRGTVQDPGLVLALDQDANAKCQGVAFRVADEQVDETLAYLRERELVSSAYLEVVLPISLKSGVTVDAVSYVIDTAHDQYCGGLPLADQAKIIALAVGGRGPNWEYLHNTVAHIHELGLFDTDLQWLDQHVKALRGE
jgi:cation transport protein ChaC